MYKNMCTHMASKAQVIQGYWLLVRLRFRNSYFVQFFFSIQFSAFIYVYMSAYSCVCLDVSDARWALHMVVVRNLFSNIVQQNKFNYNNCNNNNNNNNKYHSNNNKNKALKMR